MTEGALGAAYARVAERFLAAGKLSSVNQLLFWDSQTYMPAGGAANRGEQIAALEAAVRVLVAAPGTAELLEAAEQAQATLSPSERANLGEMRRIWRHQTAVPTELAQRKTRLCAVLQGDWAKARQSNDFGLFAKGFAELLPLHREIAAAKSEALGLEPYDALMDENDPGVNTALVEPIFDQLKQTLPALLAEVMDRQAGWPAILPFAGDFSPDRQQALAYKLLAAVGLDRQHSRIDAAPHPFTAASSRTDVRITTRFDPHNVRFAVMGTLHEAGHALYESNLPAAAMFMPVGAARGATAHESQSLLVEMQAGRSLDFLSWLAPQLHEAFGGEPAAWSAANVLNTYRRVGSGFIRVEADEISYPLHVILQYRLERALLSGDLTVADLPGAWSDLSEALFGRRPPDDAQGCLQDIHWAAGLFGYFPNYALGQILAAQLFERACADDPSLASQLAHGDFGPLREWVAPRIHHRASEVPFAQLVQDATGAPLSADALQRQLRRRYLEEPSPHQLPSRGT